MQGLTAGVLAVTLPARTPAGRRVSAVVLAGFFTGALLAPVPAIAQEDETPPGEWRYIGGDAAHTRYSGLDQITAGNFEDLEVAWVWRGDNYGAGPLGVSRATPIYVDGVLYTVAGERRTVVAIDPATGETLWTYREPHTTRFDRGNQTRIENVPGDILGYDARTGEHKWKFHVIPRPGEFGHETWENDAWEWTGDVSSWAPISADQERGLVYVPTNPPTIDFFGGFRPGDGLFGTSVIALDVQTGERVWHFQTVHHDIWNFDNPTAPVVLDVNVDGRPRQIVVQTTKQGWAFTFDRVTGEPVWPIEERPVPQSEVPGERLSPTQPMPTRPAAFEMQGLTEDDLIDFTPGLRAEALEIVGNYRIGPIFNPPIERGHPSGLRSFVSCPSGASNIFGPTSADPETGVLYVSTLRGCRSENIVPGELIDAPEDIKTTGRTIADFAVLNRGDFRGPRGLPIYKPPYSRIVAIDMNTGEHLWEAPNGDTPDRIRNHPALRGVDLPNTGQTSHPVTMVTGTLLITAEGRAGTPRLHALDKRTGERLGTVELPASGQYGMMGYLHEGRQYVVVQVAGPDLPGSLAALRLPLP